MNRNSICKLKGTGHFLPLFCLLILCGQICSQAQLSNSPLTAVKAAATAGNSVAQDKLAGEFLRRQDFLQAELWYRKAAIQGYIHSQRMLGEMLLSHAGLNAGAKSEIIAATGSEGIKWLALAANHGDTFAQAELAGAYLNGRFVKRDILEAYKWGDLAAQAPPSVSGSATGRSIRDAAMQKMSFEEIAQAKKRVVEFTTHIPFKAEPPDPAWVAQIKLTGMSGPAKARLAIINNQTFGVGDASVLRVARRVVGVRCLEIHDNSVLLHVEGINHVKELTLVEEPKILKN